jgi:hypothetical protein
MDEGELMFLLFIGTVALVFTFGVYEVERIFFP